MIRRPLALALALVLLPSLASAEDLLQTYELARQGDPQLSAAESSRFVSREGVVQARALRLPQLSGEVSGNYSRTDGGSGGGRTEIDPITGQPIIVSSDGTTENRSLSAGVNGRQMLFDRSVGTRVRSQDALSRAGDFRLESANDSLVTRTSQAYFNVLVQIETLAGAQVAEAAFQKQFDFADKRLEVGLAPITDVYEARARYDQARANTILVRNALQDAYQALAEITGQQITNLQGLPEDFVPALPASDGVDSWVRTAIETNPGLRAKQLQLESNEADIATARAGHLPTVYLTGGLNDRRSQTDASGRSFDNDSRGPSIGVTLNVPIFTGGATSSRVRQALAQRDVVTDELEQQKRGLERSTRNAYQTLVAGITEVEARKNALFSARSAYDASQVGLEVGTRTVLDVLNNQQTLFEAQRLYAQSRYNYLQNRLLLEQAAGTLDIDDVQEVNRLLTVDADAQLVNPAQATPPRR